MKRSSKRLTPRQQLYAAVSAIVATALSIWLGV